MRLLTLGVGDAFSRRFYSTSFLLEHQGFRVLIDAAHPVRKALYEAQGATPTLDIGDIDAVILTHLHGDHVSGLESMAFFFKFALQRRLPLFTHPEVAKRLWPHSLAAGMDQLWFGGEPKPRSFGFDEYFELHDLDHTSSTSVGPLEVTCRFTKHHIPTTALRISTGEELVAYSADTSFEPALIEWLSIDADFVIHETNLGTHTPYESLLSLPSQVKERLHLVHYPDDFDVDASLLRCLRQGRWYPISKAEVVL